MFETYPIHYELNGGSFLNPQTKQELKLCFLRDFYHFVNHYAPRLSSVISFEKWIELSPSEMARVKVNGEIIAKHYVEENTPKANQGIKYFIGYCLIQGLYSNLIGHLDAFFYRWRDLEEVDDQTKIHAINFYYHPWASLVDSIKYFNYDGPQDIVLAHDSGLCAKDLDILLLLKEYPKEVIHIPYKTNRHANVILPIPVREGYTFGGWFIEDKEIKEIDKKCKEEVIVTAKWLPLEK